MIKKSITVANIVEQEWLARHPTPYLITLHWGSEFIGQDFRDMCVNDYVIKRKIISMQNPQANAIVEHVHQMLGNLIRSFKLQDNPYLDSDDPWSGILAAAAFAMCSTYLIMQVNTKGAVQLRIGAVMNTINIRHIHPYKMMSSNSNHGGKCSMHHSHWAGTMYMIIKHEYQIHNDSIWTSTILCRSCALSAHWQDCMWSTSPCNP